MRRALLAVPLAWLAACGGTGTGPVDPCALGTAGAGWLSFASNQARNEDVWLIREDGTCRTPVTTDAAEDLLATWLGPDALGFFSTRVAGIGVYRHDFATGAEAKVAIGGVVAVTSPVWNADRSKVVFEARRAGVTHSEIFVAPGAGGEATDLTEHADGYNDAGPIWSPSGRIYFVSNHGGSVTQVWAMDADGGNAAAVTTGTRNVLGRPAISPDGKRLAFSRSDGRRAVIWIQDLEQPTSTASPIAISGEGNTDSDPAFDATGTRLAVSRVHGTGSPAIWIVDAADGANAVQVTTPGSGVADGQPAFRPE